MPRMGHFPFLALGLIILLLGLVGLWIKSKTSSSNAQVLAANLTFSPIPTPSFEPNLAISPTFSPSPTPSPTFFASTPNSKPAVSATVIPTSTPAPQAPQNTSSNLINNLIYPGSTVNSQSDQSLNLKSSDSPEAITNWYKDKIKQLGSKTNSFASTTTNGNVLNKLVGNNGQKEIRVEITKSSSESQTTIKVNLI